MNETPTWPLRNSPSRPAIAAVYSSFIFAGFVTIILGPLLPILITRWSLSDQAAGLFFTLQFCGNLLGILSVGWLIARRGYGQTIGLGFVLIAFGLAALDLGGHTLGLVAAAWFGYGLGLVLTSTNLWVAEGAGPRRAAALTILNLAWGLGAIACPLLMMLAQRSNRIGLLLLAAAAVSIVFALVLAMIRVEVAPQADAAESTPLTVRPAGLMVGIVLGAFFFVYCGTESAIGGWTAEFAKRMGTAGGNLWELAPMFFWAGLLAGRAIGPLYLGKISDRTVLIVGLLLAAAGNGGLLLSVTLMSAAICLAVIGFGFACVFPLLVASLVGYFGNRASRVGSVVFALASLGGASIPWLVGFVSTHVGSLRAGLSVPLAGCVVMLGLWSVLPKQSPN